MKPKYKKKNRNKGRKKRNPNSAYLALKAAYTETRLNEYLRTGIPSMTFTNFLVMHMNYPYEEATEITECYRKWEYRFEK